MNFSYGVIIAVGILVAISLSLIAADPGYLEGQPEPQKTIMVDEAPPAPMPAIISLPEGSSVPGCETTDECFIPYSVSVTVGDTVTWTNDDTAAHTVTSGTLDVGPDGLFDSGLFVAGAVFEFTFDDAGEYDYLCIVHPWMLGKVIVE
ncbi:MAG: plastocyanin/azurin family copper-binding protein [Thaumarchaeota archaeon]|nr:plastocyanin/azurin family copper-binding protein [Nitrososphaerota archaeon]